jgi:hypothetical protein
LDPAQTLQILIDGRIRGQLLIDPSGTSSGVGQVSPADENRLLDFGEIGVEASDSDTLPVFDPATGTLVRTDHSNEGHSLELRYQ